MNDSSVEPPVVGGLKGETIRPSFALRGSPVRSVLLALAVFVFALSQFLPVVNDREFHRDEARWIHRAVYIRDLLHPLSDIWDEDTWRNGRSMDEQFRLRAQPPLGSYVMGIGFLIQDGKLPDIGFWNMDFDTEWNAAQGNKPTDEQLLTGRRTNAYVSALTVVAVFLVARRVTNDVGGVVAAMFLSAHPLMIYVATFAGSDAVLGLTIALAAVAAYRFADRPTWLRAILLGVMIGLGGSAKLSPLGISAAVAAIGGVLLVSRMVFQDRNVPPSRVALQMLSTPLVAGITFVASYPYLWRDPFGNAMHLFRYRTLGMELQGTLWEGISVDSRTEAFQRIGDRLGAEMTVLGRLTSIGGQLLSSELALGVAGTVLLLWLVARNGMVSATTLAAAVLVSEAAIMIYGLEADWARYHLPILLLQATGIGIVAGCLTEVTVSGVARRQEAASRELTEARPRS